MNAMNIPFFLPKLYLLLLLLVTECGCKRGSTAIGGRGTSASRSRLSGGLLRSKIHGESPYSSKSVFNNPGRPRIVLSSKSEVGSFVAGASIGYLVHEAGSAAKLNVDRSMKWRNRTYFLNSNHDRVDMCRKFIEPNDPELGNLFFQNGTRPIELAWRCGYFESCCDNDCCVNWIPWFGIFTILLSLCFAVANKLRKLGAIFRSNEFSESGTRQQESLGSNSSLQGSSSVSAHFQSFPPFPDTLRSSSTEHLERLGP